MEEVFLLETLHSFLKTLTVILDEDQHETWNKSIDKLFTLISENGQENNSPSSDDFEQEKRTRSSNDLGQEKRTLMDCDLEPRRKNQSKYNFDNLKRNSEQIVEMMNSIEEFLNNHCSVLDVKLHNNGSVRDVVMSVIVSVRQGVTSGRWDVGSGLVRLGLALVHLLSPKGPVDPVQRAAIKLQHFKQEVSYDQA